MAVVTPPGYLQASSYSAADDRRNIVTALAQRSLKDTFNTGARGGWVVGKLPSWTVSAWAVTVSPCTGVIENTFATNAGEYVALNVANQLLTHASSSGTLNRIDIVGAVVDDAFYSGSLNDAKLEIVQGTAVSGTPTAPTLPNSFLPVYQASIPAGSSTPTITTMVRATSAAGGTPIITTYQLADVGAFIGERRGVLTTGLPFPSVLYSYYGSDGAWHGEQTIAFPRPAQTGSGSLASGSTATVASLAIPDPGFPYHIEAGGGYAWTNSAGAGIGAMGAYASVQVDSAVMNTNVITQNFQGNYTASSGSTNISNALPMNSAHLVAAGYTGTHTVYLIAQAVSSAIGILTGNLYRFGIKIIPA